MRIAFFHNLPPGGAKRVVYEQIKYLNQKHEIDLYEITSQEQNIFNPEKMVKQVYHYPFELKNNFPGFLNRAVVDYRNFISVKKLQQHIATQIDRKKYDSVIIHPDKYTQTPFILRFLKTPHLYFCEEWLRIVYEPQFAFNQTVSPIKKQYEQVTRSIRKHIDWKNMQSAQTVVANSNFTATNIMNAYKRKSEVCLLGVDTTHFRPIKTIKKYDLLFIGEKTPQEGYQLLDKAIKHCQSKPVLKILSRKNAKLALSDEDVVMEYNKAKITLALANNEPFGLIPLESMSSGTPVIALNEGGYKETIRDGKTGLLVPKDPKTLAKKIDYLLQNEEKRKHMGEKGREDMEKNWTWQKHGERLEEIIQKSLVNKVCNG